MAFTTTQERLWQHDKYYLVNGGAGSDLYVSNRVGERDTDHPSSLRRVLFVTG